MTTFRTHYDNLKVARDAPDSVIKAAYKALMQQYHPDKFDGNEQESLRIAKLIKHSYDVLIDPVNRAEHDRWIAWKINEAYEEADKPCKRQYTQHENVTPYKRKDIAYKLGDSLPDGGVIFYLDNNGKHGLAAKEEDVPGQFNWNDAKLVVRTYGADWRLPTQNELDLLCRSADIVGGFGSESLLKMIESKSLLKIKRPYWSSTKYLWLTWCQAIEPDSVEVNGQGFDASRYYKLNVRAIKNF